jgi:hypothetical protein
MSQRKAYTGQRSTPCHAFQGGSPRQVPTGNHSGIVYYWSGNADCSIGDEDINHIYDLVGGIPNIIQRDDDFVVLNNCSGWIVWCFDKGVLQPQGRAEFVATTIPS